MAGDSITILKIDIDRNPTLASSLDIQSVPTLILFMNGQIKWRQSGVVRAQQLYQIIKQFS
jgi:thioredoxin 1